MRIKPVVKILLASLAFLLVAVSGFFFWASSANYPEESYRQYLEYDYPSNPDHDSVYTVVTYNIGYLSGMTNNRPVVRRKQLYDANLRKVYHEFKQVKADIICLQEIDYHANRSFYVNQQAELAKAGYNYVFQAVNWDVRYLPYPYWPVSAHYGEVLSGQSILSKYPLQENERHVLARVASAPFYRQAFYLDRLAQVSQVDINGQTVIIINVHLEAFDKTTRATHTRYVAELYKKFSQTYPVLLAGDFNSDVGDGNATIKTIFALPGIKSAVAAGHKTYPANQPAKRLDYIFYNEPYIEAIEAGILSSFGEASDHLPVMLTFRLK